MNALQGNWTNEKCLCDFDLLPGVKSRTCLRTSVWMEDQSQRSSIGLFKRALNGMLNAWVCVCFVHFCLGILPKNWLIFRHFAKRCWLDLLVCQKKWIKTFSQNILWFRQFNCRRIDFKGFKPKCVDLKAFSKKCWFRQLIAKIWCDLGDCRQNWLT